MKRSLLILWTSLLIMGVLQQTSWMACAAEPRSAPGLLPRSIEFTATELAPLLSIDEAFSPAAGMITTAAHEETAAASGAPAIETVAGIARPGETSLSPAESREQLRSALTDAGMGALSERDHLTQDVLNIAQWTALILIGGLLTAVGVKQFSRRGIALPPASAMKLTDTLKIGRGQGLHLVEIGNERFVVAADGNGIKSVLLLPGWPALEADEGEPVTLRFADRGLRQTEIEESGVAA